MRTGASRGLIPRLKRLHGPPQPAPSGGSNVADPLARWGLFVFCLLVIGSHVGFFAQHVLPSSQEEMLRMVAILDREMLGADRLLNYYLLEAGLRFGVLVTDWPPARAALLGLVLLWALAIPSWFLVLRGCAGNERFAFLATVLLFGSPEVVNLGRSFVEHGMVYLLGVGLVALSVLLRQRWYWLAPLLGLLLLFLSLEAKTLVPVLLLAAAIDALWLLRERPRWRERLAAVLHWGLPILGFFAAYRATPGASVAYLGARSQDQVDLLYTLRLSCMPPERVPYGVLFVAVLLLGLPGLLRAGRSLRRTGLLLVLVGPILVLPLFFIQLRNEYVCLFTALSFYPLLALLIHCAPIPWARGLLTTVALAASLAVLGSALLPAPSRVPLEASPTAPNFPPRFIEGQPSRMGHTYGFRIHPVVGPMNIDLLVRLPPHYVVEIPESAVELHSLCPSQFVHGRRAASLEAPQAAAGRPQLSAEDRTLFLFSWEQRCYITRAEQPADGEQVVVTGVSLDPSGARALRVQDAEPLVVVGLAEQRSRDGLPPGWEESPGFVWMEVRVSQTPQDEARPPTPEAQAVVEQPPAAGPCPEGMIFIAGGPYTVGVEGPPDPDIPWREPARAVQIEAYCIDRYEYPNVEGERPQGVSWDQADRLCRERGRRLCSSSEWERACRGTARWFYSYAEQHDPQRCNTPVQGGGVEGPSPVASSGAFSGCHSPEGVYDLNGNLSEWVSDAWSEFAPPFEPDAVVDPATWRTVRGGTMWKATFYGQDCSSRHGHPRSEFFEDDGFRCCAEPL